MSADFSPHMIPAEVALLSTFVPKDGTCLEFGSGGSTQFFLEKGIGKLYSVDSDRAWLEKLFENPAVRIFHKHGRWVPLYADIGHTEDWGAPAIHVPSIIWLNYHQHIWSHIHENAFDLILVDGRFRVACLLQCLLRCSNEKAVILMHDFWNRPHYHEVLDFLDVLEKADSLGVFKPKKNLDWQKLGILLQERQFDWR